MKRISVFIAFSWLCAVLGVISPAHSQTRETAAPRVIHVLVALCDNVNQGIVPVPAHLGNGEDPAKNLYWGAAFGVKTYFQRAKDWQLVSTIKNPSTTILERLIFKKQGQNVWLVADAYRGSAIRETTLDLLDYAAGRKSQKLSVEAQNQTLSLPIGGAADLIAYVGHDGLMDFSISPYPKRADAKKRDLVILACASKQYFSAAIKEGGAKPLVLTTNLMAPEAYSLKAIADAWAEGAEPANIRIKAAEAYAKYQKINLSAAKRLFSE